MALAHPPSTLEGEIRLKIYLKMSMSACLSVYPVIKSLKYNNIIKFLQIGNCPMRGLQYYGFAVPVLSVVHYIILSETYSFYRETSESCLTMFLSYCFVTNQIHEGFDTN